MGVNKTTIIIDPETGEELDPVKYLQKTKQVSSCEAEAPETLHYLTKEYKKVFERVEGEPPKFFIGDFVKVQRIVKMSYIIGTNYAGKAHKRVFRKHFLKDFVYGYIVGAVRRQLGEYKSGGYFWDGEETSYLKVTGTVLLWQIKTGFLNTPLDVLEEDIILLEKTCLQNKIPWKKVKGF